MSSSGSDGEAYTVECIVKCKGAGKAKQYLVKWEDYPDDDNTWEPAKNLPAGLISEFEADNGGGEDSDDESIESVSDKDDGEYQAAKAPKRKAPAPPKPPKAAAAAAGSSASSAAPPAKKAKSAAAAAKESAAEAKAVVSKLGVLDKAQLVGVISALVGSGTVAPAEVEAVLPAPDMAPLLKEAQRLCNAIRRALPNSRWGSCTDHYGYKRCASANNACKKYIVDHAKTFKAARQWAAAAKYCEEMLPIAHDMVRFDQPGDCKARDGAIAALEALQAEAASKMPKPA